MPKTSILLAVATYCALGALPTLASDDGMVRTLTKQQICSTKWGKDERHVSESMKRKVFAAAGFPLGNKDPRCPCEADHIVPRELAGADSVANLQIQQYFGPCNAHIKDRLENEAHEAVCSGQLSLADAQRWFEEHPRPCAGDHLPN
jgi:hypothetical protein